MAVSRSEPAMRALRLFLASLAIMFAAACASTGASSQASALEKAQYGYSAAIRWGDLDAAWAQLDPQWRAAHPLTDIERNRWQQVQITAYRPQTSEADGEGGSRRMIEIGVVNRHTMTERQVRYVERWRWDAAAKAWYISGGLPDLWAGQ